MVFHPIVDSFELITQLSNASGGLFDLNNFSNNGLNFKYSILSHRCILVNYSTTCALTKKPTMSYPYILALSLGQLLYPVFS